MNQELIDWIKSQEAQGYTEQQLIDYLVQQGHQPQDIQEAMNNLQGQQNNNTTQTPSYSQTTTSPQKKYLVIGIILLVILGIGATLFFILTKPVCGNGELERGETAETCCMDAGCKGGQTCQNDKCTDPTCETCQYLENSICKQYVCCIDQDCDDKKINTQDTCIESSTKSSECIHAQKIELSDIEKDITISTQESISFNINEEDHRLDVEAVTDESATITIYSKPKTITLKIGESQEIDLDEDGNKDIIITLKEIKNKKPTFTIKSLEKANNLLLGITSSKDTYEMAEPVSGEYKIRYSGEPFDAILLFTHGREGHTKTYGTTLKGSINSIKKTLTAFRLDDHGYAGGKEYFYDEGNYYYTISAYNCELLAAKLKKDCSDINEKDLTNIEPLKTMNKTITIKGGINPSECRESNECTNNCTGCITGSQLCTMPSEKCEDCFMNSQCITGYACKNNTCINWECDVNIDCNDNNILTNDTCENYTCIYVNLTTNITNTTNTTVNISVCKDDNLVCPETCNYLTDNDCENPCDEEITNCGITGVVNDCYINASKNCCPANITIGTELNFMGILLRSEMYNELQGTENEKCIVYQQIKNYTMNISEEMRQEMLLNNTEEEIDQYIKEENLQYQEMIGKESTCYYPITDLVIKLENEQNGSYSGSTSDIETYNCTGSMYET